MTVVGHNTVIKQSYLLCRMRIEKFSSAWLMPNRWIWMTDKPWDVSVTISYLSFNSENGTWKLSGSIKPGTCGTSLKSKLDRNDRKSLRTEGIKRSEINRDQALFDHFINLHFSFLLRMKPCFPYAETAYLDCSYSPKAINILLFRREGPLCGQCIYF